MGAWRPKLPGTGHPADETLGPPVSRWRVGSAEHPREQLPEIEETLSIVKSGPFYLLYCQSPLLALGQLFFKSGGKALTETEVFIC